MTPRLMTPGPTALLEAARLAMAEPILHHRTEPFREIVRECRESLKRYFRTSQDVILLTSSGTGGMEAALVNLCSPGDRVLVGSCGKFGDRWAEIARAHHLEVEVMKTEAGRALEPEAIGRRLEDLRPRALLVTASETSVGVKNDLETLARLGRQAAPQTLIVADAITAVGAFPFETEAWGVDVAVGSSQKALSLPPGLAFVTLSERARDAAARASLPRYYFDLQRERAKQAQGDIGFTPAITLIVGLRAALRHFLDRGMERVWADAARKAAATRAGLRAMGIELVARDGASESVTAAWVPSGIDGAGLLKDLERTRGIKIAGGQGELKGRIFRIAHFGPVTDADTLDCLSGIADLVGSAGRTVDRREALSAAERALEASA